MTQKAKIKIENQVIEMISKSIKNTENADTLEVDGITCNFVDADVHMDVSKAGLVFEGELNDFIEYCINEYLEFGEIEDNGALAA